MNGFPSIHKINIFAENKMEFAQFWETIINTKSNMIYTRHENHLNVVNWNRI